VRYACGLALACALLVVPAAGAVGLSIGYTVRSGTVGDNGWYRSAVTVDISVQGASDTTCPSVKTFRTNTDPPLDCSATDGNATIPFHLQFKIDTDAPSVTGASPARAADANGWFNHSVSLAFAGSDATSGIASCSVVSYSGPDSATATVSGTCRDGAGNVSAASSTLQYDATPPSVNASTDRSADSGGWYNHQFTVSFSGSDGTSGIDSCAGTGTYSGPDTAGASLSGSCVDKAGNRATGSLSLKYDATPPSADAKPARAPDDNGWYTHSVAVAFSGSDALSGVAGCTAAKTYDGPDSGGARVAGSCSDNAGNDAPVSMPLKYDATPPRLQGLTVAVGNGDALLTWRQPADVASVAITRSPGRKGKGETVVYKGTATRARDSGLKAGVLYRYRLVSVDPAGNRAVAQVAAKLRTLYAPAPGARAHAGGALRWSAQKGTAYYNVQLYRHGRKVLSTWPVEASFRLPRRWSYSGRVYRLTRGTYRWYVWPGRGARSQARYGPLLGSSFFTVR
jgi:hypothetical protein